MVTFLWLINLYTFFDSPGITTLQEELWANRAGSSQPTRTSRGLERQVIQKEKSNQNNTKQNISRKVTSREKHDLKMVKKVNNIREI